jgi:hypothetical protein
MRGYTLLRLRHAFVACVLSLALVVLVWIGVAGLTFDTKKSGTSSPELARSSAAKQSKPVRSLELDIPAGSYFASEEGRGLLKYLVRCALDVGTEARLELPGETISYTGAIGLAPEWAERPLTMVEQRWVSACILALTNKLGRSVRVNLRAAHPSIGQADTEEEERVYSLHEGGFFGNLFLPEPKGYVCQGTDVSRTRAFPIGNLRLCAQPSGISTLDGRPLSQCGFIITGPCNSIDSFVLDGEPIEEVVHVWLSPEPRE